jgi:hypothetical protein
VLAYSLPSGPNVTPVYQCPAVVDCATFTAAAGYSLYTVPAAVENELLNPTNAAPPVSFRAGSTSNVYSALSSSGWSGRRTIASPPPLVFTTAGTFSRAFPFSSSTDPSTVALSITRPGFGRFTSAAMNASAGRRRPGRPGGRP